ncbi:hypothetical protein Palpr_2133 [Paludibacter propionicigenes WB4]|uniref:Uncharacterized protein n=1 Tax=Paludibacter propionicigenes (strain DSM 17365 / JCM 13257 / WB4) TaxID=694427 RepID=E4T6C5_PALPW|nr:hypothetical protein [Paludibacter propionicigenes]ADQ80269.1 hypothetical protein Palpr_2133 [Paludibacter propionicigenes WB4]
MKLQEVLNKIQFDKELTAEFLKDPQKVLKEQGLDTKDLFIDEMQSPKSVKAAPDLCVKVCAKVGAPFVGCHEVGHKEGL